MLKKLTLLFVLFLFTGCAGGQLRVSDDSTHKVLSYAAGKGMAIGIQEIRPEVDPDLTAEWVDMMERNAGKAEVGSMEMVAFYNQCLIIVTGGEFDQYGLINDLSMLLTIFSAEIDPATNQMIFIKPVPYEILKFFEMGYANGRQVSRKD